MKFNALYGVSTVIFFLLACRTGEPDFRNCEPISPSASDLCYQNGVPFVAPNGISNFWELERSELCCDESVQTITTFEYPCGGGCYANDIFYVCLKESADGECDDAENFCTSPLDCEPPDHTYELCCGEGDICQGLGSQFSPTGVSQCCSGLDMVEYAWFSDNLQSCIYIPYPDLSICVKECGDSICSDGENQCNCPSDCG